MAMGHLRTVCRSRRKLLAAAWSAAALGGCSFTLEHGLFNPCGKVPARGPAAREAVRAAWDGIDAAQVWDCHAHLVGDGDSSSGIWLNPATRSVARPTLYARRLLYMNAACAEKSAGTVDDALVARMQRLLDGMEPGAKMILLAFDWRHSEDGDPVHQASAFHVPDGYAMTVASRHRRYFEWAASIHPYRRDCVPALRAAKAKGARAVKWLPQTMGIDPASPRCDAFYAELAKLGLPLLTHGGRESAAGFAEPQELGNPLRLRRALEHGVKVVVAHCATLGQDRDLDKGQHGPYVDSFALFARLMDDHRYGARLYGDLSAVAQVNRANRGLMRLLQREDWHPRLLNGSDYPLPGVIPLHSMSQLVGMGLLDPALAPALAEIREHNPLLFDFVLKRHLHAGTARFAKRVFETRPFFQTSA